MWAFLNLKRIEVVRQPNTNIGNNSIENEPMNSAKLLLN